MGDFFDLTGRVALITGAAGYLGRAMARALLDAGAVVYLNARTEERCAPLLEELRDTGGRVEPAIFDVTDGDAVKAFFDGWGETPLHILINNAYQGGPGTIETTIPQSYDDSYHVTVTAAHMVLTAALPSLRKGVQGLGDASVINVGSMYGMVSPDLRVYDGPESSNPPFYGAAKAALIHWSRYAACEFGREGIRVNALSPGPFPSVHVQEAAAPLVEKLAEKVPMNRIGQAEDIGGPVVFLASPASRYVNGTNLVVDGGWTAW